MLRVRSSTPSSVSTATSTPKLTGLAASTSKLSRQSSSGAVRRCAAPALDGCRSPFGVEPRLDGPSQVRLPPIAVSRSSGALRDDSVRSSFEPSSSSFGRRSAPLTRLVPETPLDLRIPPLTAPLEKKSRSHRHHQHRRTTSQACDDRGRCTRSDTITEAPLAALELDLRLGRRRAGICDSKGTSTSSPTSAPHKSRRMKTWAATQLATQLSLLPSADSTPSVLTPQTTCSETGTSQASEASVRFAIDLLPTPEAGKWKKGSKIGSGSYGSVYKALDKETGRIFAVKKAQFEEGDSEDRKLRDRITDELSICKDLRHPNIVSYLGHEYTDCSLYIYLEYVAGGSMSSVLNEFGPLDHALLASSTQQLLDGLQYLHTRSVPVSHRDIKGANILVDLSFCVKLADFGCSKRSSNTKSFTTVGSIPWMAPEVISQQDGYGRKADVWSLGCTVIEMATAEKPWGKNTFDNIMFAMRHIGLSNNTPPVPETVSGACQDFIEKCTRRQPDDRPWTEELLQHPFVSGRPGDRSVRSSTSRGSGYTL